VLTTRHGALPYHVAPFIPATWPTCTLPPDIYVRYLRAQQRDVKSSAAPMSTVAGQKGVTLTGRG
jgi:hypothetical protein